jgi:hypothetical protein
MRQAAADDHESGFLRRDGLVTRSGDLIWVPTLAYPRTDNRIILISLYLLTTVFVTDVTIITLKQIVYICNTVTLIVSLVTPDGARSTFRVLAVKK